VAGLILIPPGLKPDLKPHPGPKQGVGPALKLPKQFLPIQIESTDIKHNIKTKREKSIFIILL
jgi:hypothetical protein